MRAKSQPHRKTRRLAWALGPLCRRMANALGVWAWGVGGWVCWAEVTRINSTSAGLDPVAVAHLARAVGPPLRANTAGGISREPVVATFRPVTRFHLVPSASLLPRADRNWSASKVSRPFVAAADRRSLCTHTACIAHRFPRNFSARWWWYVLENKAHSSISLGNTQTKIRSGCGYTLENLVHVATPQRKLIRNRIYRN